MLGKIFEAMYLKIFVNIVPKHFNTVVYIEKRSRKGIVSSLEEEFKTLECNESMYEFITTHSAESPYVYISVLDVSHLQGAVPTCSKERMKFYLDLEKGEYRCHNNWAYYTEKENLLVIKKRYSIIGIDYIFSPFTILSCFFKDKIDGKTAMYILVQENFLSLAIFENSQLLYAHHLDMMPKDDFNGIKLEDEQENNDLLLSDAGDIELDDLSGLDDGNSELEDFGNIEDLDSLEDIDEFSDSKNIEEEFLEFNNTLNNSDNNKFNEDYQRFTLIQSSVGQFYKDTRFESRFIEDVYVADSIGVTNDFKKYLEEEMFFNVYIRQIDLALEVCELAKRELEV